MCNATGNTGGNVITAELGGTKYFLNASLLLQRLAVLPHDPDASSSLQNVTPVASLAGYPAQDATDVRFRGPCSSDGGVPMPSQSAAQQDSWPTCCERYMQPPQLILFEEDNCSTGATGHSAVKPRAATPVESQACSSPFNLHARHREELIKLLSRPPECSTCCKTMLNSMQA
jgi:hypothetical protein